MNLAFQFESHGAHASAFFDASVFPICRWRIVLLFLFGNLSSSVADGNCQGDHAPASSPKQAPEDVCTKKCWICLYYCGEKLRMTNHWTNLYWICFGKTTQTQWLIIILSIYGKHRSWMRHMMNRGAPIFCSCLRLNYGNFFVAYFGTRAAMTRHDPTSFDELLR